MPMNRVISWCRMIDELDLFTEKFVYCEAMKETALPGSVLCSALEVEQTLLLRLECI